MSKVRARGDGQTIGPEGMGEAGALSPACQAGRREDAAAVERQDGAPEALRTQRAPSSGLAIAALMARLEDAEPGSPPAAMEAARAPTPPPAPASTPAQAPLRHLKKGTSGDDVRALQAELRRAGVDIPVTGTFDDATRRAVRGFQKAHGCLVDGIVGPETRGALARALSGAPSTGRGTDGTGPAAPARRTGRAAPSGPAAPAVPAEGPGEVAPVARGRAAARGVRFIHQFDPAHIAQRKIDNKTGCLDACKAMMRTAGVRTGKLRSVARSENADGRVNVDPARSREMISHLDEQLAAGRPVTVGVSHHGPGGWDPTIHDHFVVIVGRGVDERGRPYYQYYDPATSHKSAGTNPDRNRFYPDANGKLVHAGEIGGRSFMRKHTEVSHYYTTSDAG